jgi:predicted GNAT family N-acyltransferase
MNPDPFRAIAHGGPEYLAAVTLRDRILRAPLGLAFTKIELAAEGSDWHLAGFDPGSGDLVACLVLTPLGNGVAKMRQVAVTESHRGRGWGRDAVMFAETFARRRGIREIVLNARETVVGFYLPLGYTVEGEPFVEVTLPHRRMRKALES